MEMDKMKSSQYAFVGISLRQINQIKIHDWISKAYYILRGRIKIHEWTFLMTSRRWEKDESVLRYIRFTVQLPF